MVKKDIFGNIIPKSKWARDEQFRKITAMQREDEEKRCKASFKQAKKNMKLNYPNSIGV